MTDTLKSICEQCTNLQSQRLDFIPANLQREREIIHRDLKELVAAASFEHKKSVVVLAGGLFESVLYCFIQTQTAYISGRRGEQFIFNREHSLQNYVSIFNRYFSTLLAIPDSVVDYRDFVHINQERQFASDTCETAAPEMLRLLNALLGKLNQYVSP